MKPKYKSTLALIKEVVENKFDLYDISSARRQRKVVNARYIFYRLCKDFTFSSLDKIGKTVNRDHSSVMHGLKRFELIEYWKENQYLIPYEVIKKELTHRLEVLKLDEGLTLEQRYDALVEQNVLLKQQSEDLKLFIHKNLRDFLRKVKKTYGYMPFHAREKHRKLKETLKKIT